MAQRVEDLYNKLATITGFPLYTNATDTPDTNRLLFRILSDGLQNVIDCLYIDNNILQRTDKIITTPNQDLYGVAGLIKNCQLIDSDGKIYQLPYNDKFNPHVEINHDVKTTTAESSTPVLKNTGRPLSYCIEGGYLRLLPMPDKEYTIRLTLSTTELVWANDDESKTMVDDIEDIILADKRFCDLVVLKAAVILFLRANNNNANIYNELFNGRLATYIEHDNGTMEAQRGFIRRAGHYDPRRGLLD